MKRWSKERAWQWYNSRPWIRGCNFMSSDCANRIDQWQSLGFEERLETTDRELELAAKNGFNSIRIILEFIVWKEEHDTFFDRFDRYLEVCAKHGISCMVVFGNDCMPPKRAGWRPLSLGVQHYDWGYHGGRKNSQHGTFDEEAPHIIDDPEIAEEHYQWVRETVTRYKDDERIIIWDIWNELGNGNRKLKSVQHAKRFIEIIREIDPIQPITLGIWRGFESIDDINLEKLSEEECFALENSDIVSYHNYWNYSYNVALIRALKRLGRPMINTEWLNRCEHNTVQELFPLFYTERVGCFNWGFVAGKYQTYEPYNSFWDRYEQDPNLDFDFTKWFHDLYRPSLRPYDPREIEVIKRFSRFADEDFEYSLKSDKE